MSEWISTKKQLPKEHQEVFVWYRYPGRRRGRYAVAFFYHGLFVGSTILEGVKWWMPIKPPKGVKP